MQAIVRRRYYLAHFVMLAVSAQVVMLWASWVVSDLAPWRPAGGLDAVFITMMMVAVVFYVGIFAAYAVVTSVFALLVRGHWSALVFDASLAIGVIAFARS